MRVLPILLVCLSVAFAGCSGDEETPPADTPPTTTATPTNPTATPTAPTNTTPTVSPTPRPAPVDVCAISHDYTPEPGGLPSDPSNPTPPETEPCTIPAGYRNVALNGNFTGSPPGASNGIAFALKDSSGADVVTCALGSTTPSPAPTPVACTGTGSITAPGDHTLVFTGTGTWTLTATLTLTA